MSPTKNFEKTLGELKKYVAMPIETDRDRAGIIQAFEFTFEQTWKAIQKLAYSMGSEVGSPKTAFSFALQNGWILVKDEEQWLQMIKDRNMTSHTYQAQIAKDILERVQANYIRLFAELLRILTQIENT